MSVHKSQVVSRQGRRGTFLTALARIGVELALAAALIVLAAQLGMYMEGRETTGWTVAVLLAIVAGILGVVEIRVGVGAARKEERRVRRNILTRIFAAESLPKNDSDAFSSARLVQLMTDNAERMTDYRQQYLGSTIAALLTPALLTGYITLAVDWRIGLGMMASVFVVPVLVLGFLRIFRGVSAKSRAQRALLTTKYLDAIRHLTPIRLYGAGARMERELREHGERNRKAIMRILAGNQIVIIVLDGVFSLAFVCWSVLLISWGIGDGRLTPTGALTLLFLLVLLLEPLNQVAGFFYVGMGGIASKRAIGRYLAAHPADTRVDSDERLYESQHAVDVVDVSYDYGRGQVLNCANLRVDYGQKVVLVGASGAGKSTLLGLLKGALPLQTGQITVAGRHLTDLSPAQIRKLSATVSQSTWLFSGAIADNLRMVNRDATEADMWHVLERAHIADEVRRMPDGLNTDVGENGSRLSGGQAQRISLARAFLSGRKILLLDEPTSHVDAESEAHIIDAITEIGSDLTTIIVTHRPALMRIADKTYYVSNGDVSEGENK
ncbi:ATP-binding cassette domain-containing protein [Trueperella pyogenes]|uniref:ABC transporter ATP-binding protein/permease n=1 Tax=Trueperella pyogenes TaxID=1661 RepID=UPI003244E250